MVKKRNAPEEEYDPRFQTAQWKTALLHTQKIFELFLFLFVFFLPFQSLHSSTRDLLSDVVKLKFRHTRKFIF